MRPATGESEPSIEQLEERLDNLRISADSDITIRGSAWQGYAVNIPFCGETSTRTPCPDHISIKFTGVIFDCGCRDVGGGHSRIYEEGNFNTTVGTFTKTLDIGGSCVWTLDDCVVGETYAPLLHSYDGPICEGTPEDVMQEICFPLVELFGGSYILSFISHLGETIFTGSTPDWSLPIANTNSCGGGANGIAHGGTATVTIL